MNSLLFPPGWGAWSAAWFDLSGEKPVTPLMGWHTEPKAG
jgi:hypothetical protein